MMSVPGFSEGRAVATRLPRTAVLTTASKTKSRFMALHSCTGKMNLEAQSETHPNDDGNTVLEGKGESCDLGHRGVLRNLSASLDCK